MISTCTNMVGHTFTRFDRRGKIRKNGREVFCLTCGAGKVACPHCQATVIVSIDPWDKLVDCPVCQKRFQVPRKHGT